MFSNADEGQQQTCRLRHVIRHMQSTLPANALFWLIMSEVDEAMRQVWLQEFAWTEADKPVKLEARSMMAPNDPTLARQPIFCFQTMMNMLYWSCFVYDHARVRLPKSTQTHLDSQQRWCCARHHMATHTLCDAPHLLHAMPSRLISTRSGNIEIH